MLSSTDTHRAGDSLHTLRKILVIHSILRRKTTPKGGIRRESPFMFASCIAGNVYRRHTDVKSSFTTDPFPSAVDLDVVNP